MGTKPAGRKDVSIERKMLEREANSESTEKRIEPKYTEQKVQVIYYLSRNGQLEHPHLMEVPVSSPQGMLCLKDVINRLSFLRGQGMANMYSWSTKRSYKNGYVWQDLTENDLIYPSSGHEYVLKGTQLVEKSLSFRSCETISTPSSKSSTETTNTTCSTGVDSPATMRGRSQSWSSLDYKLYKAKTCKEFSGKAANASTQTEEKKGKQRMKREKVEECEGKKFSESVSFSTSSFGASEEGDGSAADIRNQKVENERSSGRIRASEVLMQLIRCKIVNPLPNNGQ